jgi:peptidoglycan/LPS O-acetylase OafA/YrhL
MLNQESSERLNLIRFPLIVGVVFIHAYASTVGMAGGEIGNLQHGQLNEHVRDFISEGLARVAVPLFYFMSGFLFFHHFVWSKEAYLNKLRGRVKTLLVPFLFWNLLTLAVYATAQAIPATSIYFSGRWTPPVAAFGTFDYFNLIFGLNRYPIAYQFWFVRDLMFLVVVSPFIYFLLKRFSLLLPALVFIFWISNRWPIYIPYGEGLLFFCVGAYIGIRSFNPFGLDKYGKIIAIIYFVILMADTLTKGQPYNYPIHKTGIVFGLVSVLYLTRFVVQRPAAKKVFLWLSATSFFVYAFHEPLLIIVRKLIYKFFAPSTNFEVLAGYFLAPCLVISISIGIYLVLRHMLPKFTRIIVGGR